VFVDYSAVIVVGERPVVLCLAPSQKQAGIVFAYVAGILGSVPMLAKLIPGKTAEIIALTNGLEIEVRSASFRNVRGVTCVAVVADEACFWYSDDSGSVNPDSAILDALRPALATTGGLLAVISSPYARRGAVYETHARHNGEKGDPRILVAQGASRDFNPSLPQKVVDRAMERGPAAASAEYGGLFRSDLETFLSRDLIDNAVDRGVMVRPPRPDLQYVGYVDAASGVGKDSFAVAIAHVEGEQVIIDLAHEIRPPFNPTSATGDVAALLKSYRVTTVCGDKYDAGFVIEAHSKCGINYLYSDNDTSTNYLDALPLFTSGRVRLVDNNRLVAQFAGLERRTGPSGRDRVDHGVGDRHDDISAAVSGALVLATQHEPDVPIVMPIVSSTPRPAFPHSDFHRGAGGLQGAIMDTRKSGFSIRSF
jgi:hypothetical protein